MSDEKQESSSVAICVLLSISTTFFQNPTKCKPESRVSFSTLPNTVIIPVCPVGTRVADETNIPIMITIIAVGILAPQLISL